MAWLNTAREAGLASIPPSRRMRRSARRESMPSDSSIACMSDALSLQSPKRRARIVSTGYGFDEVVADSHPPERLRGDPKAENPPVPPPPSPPRVSLPPSPAPAPQF